MLSKAQKSKYKVKYLASQTKINNTCFFCYYFSTSFHSANPNFRRPVYHKRIQTLQLQHTVHNKFQPVDSQTHIHHFNDSFPCTFHVNLCYPAACMTFRLHLFSSARQSTVHYYQQFLFHKSANYQHISQVTWLPSPMALYWPKLQFYVCVFAGTRRLQQYYNNITLRLFFIFERDIVCFLCAMHVFKVRPSSSHPRLPLCQILFLSQPLFLS